MKKITLILKSTLAVALMCMMSLSVQAQSGWRTNAMKGTPQAAPAYASGTAGTVYVSHCRYNEQIYQGDGLSYGEDHRVGAAVKLTRDMIEPYIGGEVKALRVGWDTRAKNGEFECFIRTSFNGPNIATGKGTVKFGWNVVRLDSTFIIPDVDELIVGYYTELVANECCLPLLFPRSTPNSCFLFDGQTDENGQEIWGDYNELGQMAIVMNIADTDGRFNNMGKVTNVRYENIAIQGEAGTGIFTIKNTGSNAITSVEVTSILGEERVSKTVKLSASVAANVEKKVSLPITFPGSGKGKVSLTQVNGVDLANPFEKEVTFIAVPQEVAQKYQKRPVVEFYVSENSYMVPTYFDDYFMADFADFVEDYSLVCQHTDDQFMTGDDDAILMMLSLANNDSTKILMPQMTIDRTDYLINLPMLDDTPFLYGIPYPGNAQSTYRSLLSRPTFANLDVEVENVGESDSVRVNVSGCIEPGIMPSGEPLFLTVYLMESQVETNSQKFWEDKEGEKPAGNYTHYNVIRATSPGANSSGSQAASASMKNTFCRPSSMARSMATTMASGTFSTAMSRVSGCALAVPAVKRPLPQPSSTSRFFAWGYSSRQWPRRSSGRRIQQSPQASMRGCRFFFFRIRMMVFSSQILPRRCGAISATSYHKI